MKFAIMRHAYLDAQMRRTRQQCITTRVIDKWCSEHGYTKSWHCPKFKDQITGKPMYDCAFQWYEEEK